MTITKETIGWHWINESMPDSDTTVLTFSVDDDEPVWLGYHDGECWRSIKGAKISGVSFWAHLPIGPLPKQNLTDLRQRLTPKAHLTEIELRPEGVLALAKIFGVPHASSRGA